MKSKISFFNKTIFWKNVTLYWPIWGIYTLLVFIYQPIIFGLVSVTANFYAPYTKAQRFEDLVSCLHFEPYVLIIAFAALITGMALYSYMYNSKSANMIHSLPVDRTQLYGTTLITGWTFLVVPLFASALLTTIICVIYGVPGIPYIWIWFLAVAALAIIAFAIVTVCALFTGHIVVLPLYTVAVNVFSWVIYYLVYIVVTTFGYGVSELSDTAYNIARFFCPIQSFSHGLDWQRQYSDSSELVKIAFDGTGLIVLYLIIAVVFYIVAYMTYRKRKIELAGDFLTVNWVKPIFRGIIGIIGAIFGAMVMREILLEIRMGCSVVTFVVMMLVIGAIFYFAADMFVSKSFHVFKKKNWIGYGIFSVVLLVFFGGMYGVAEKYERYIPNTSELKSATVHLGYEVSLSGEEAGKIVEIHGDIMKELHMIERIIESGDRDHESVRISYHFKNGQELSRRYQLPSGLTTIQPAIEKVVALEDDEENFLKHIFCEEYKDIKFFNGGHFEAQFLRSDRPSESDEYPDTSYDSITLDTVQTKALYEAIIADTKAGTLMKYNVSRGSLAENEQEIYYVKASDATLTIDYNHPSEVANMRTIYTDKDETMIYYSETAYDSMYSEGGYMSAYVSFGPDCENIVNTLMELGIIKSVDEIWWGDAEELLK